MFRNSNARISVFTQHHVDQLNLSQSPLEHFNECFPGSDMPTLRAQLGRFGVSGNLALQTISTLSGGQKSRVAFAKIMMTKPHLVLFGMCKRVCFQPYPALTVSMQMNRRTYA